ncbi:MAG: hypothetical protein JW814_09170 [Candidatus Krumholzibacteriota bacterium]|nr:hypothetical protein [Candidatus Krumholzibacteriota bacterium]
MKVSRCFLSVFCLVLLAGMLVPQQGNAIPAFARKYKISCNTCHSVIPRLKDYGDEFAANAFTIPEKENKRDYITAGDDLLWLNKDFPLAARIDLFAAFDEDQRVENDLQIPWGLKLLSGGTLYKNIGYYFYFFMSERGEVAGVEDAYIHFRNVFNSKIDVLAGQFQVCDPLMKRELRLTYEDYLVYKVSPGSSTINLTYDRGLVFAYTLEKTGSDLVAMVVNGNGKGEAVDDKLDQDDYKNYALRLNQGIGDIVTIGGFYYAGKEKSPGSGRTNDVTYYGPDLTFGMGPVELTAQYLYRKDTNPEFLTSSDDLETHGYVVEMMFAPDIDNSRYFFTGLYNLVDSKVFDYETATLSYTYLISRNLRFIAEYTRDLAEERNRGVLGMVGAF